MDPRTITATEIRDGDTIEFEQDEWLIRAQVRKPRPIGSDGQKMAVTYGKPNSRIRYFWNEEMVVLIHRAEPEHPLPTDGSLIMIGGAPLRQTSDGYWKSLSGEIIPGKHNHFIETPDITDWTPAKVVPADHEGRQVITRAAFKAARNAPDEPLGWATLQVILAALGIVVEGADQ